MAGSPINQQKKNKQTNKKIWPTRKLKKKKKKKKKKNTLFG